MRPAAIATLLGLTTFGLVGASGATGTAWADPGGGSSGAHSEHAVCGAVSAGFSTCFVHLLDASSASSSTPTGLPPVALTSAYGFPAASSNPSAGSGETVGIVDAFDDPTIASDLSSFSTQFGLPACTTANLCFSKVNQSGGSTYPRANSGWDLEISLDVEWVHALAPGAHILLVEASSNSNSNLFAAVAFASKHAQYVSMSWGGGESSGETSLDKTYFPAGGPSFFAASGDSGAGAEYPSSSPNVVSVGGTTLNVSHSGGSYSFSSETDWSGGGGGCSAYEAATSAQTSFPTYSQVGCGGARATPDLSLDANPNTGVSVYDTSGQSGWLTVGGTSASTQFVAAEAAVAGLSMTPSVLYGPNLAYYEISSCTNGEPSVGGGYDLCTGLGSWNPANGSVNSGGGGGGSPPPAPTGVHATPADSQVTLSWNASAGANSYTVYWGTSSTSPPASVGCTTTTTSCPVTSLSNGTPYYFDVVASDGQASPPSTVVSATPEPGTTTTISVSSVSYFVSGRRGSTLNLTVALVPAVSGASVSVSLYLNGSLYGSANGTTGSGGTASFYASGAPSGTYTTTVTNVTASGYSWDGQTPANSYTK